MSRACVKLVEKQAENAFNEASVEQVDDQAFHAQTLTHLNQETSIDNVSPLSCLSFNVGCAGPKKGGGGVKVLKKIGCNKGSVREDLVSCTPIIINATSISIIKRDKHKLVDEMIVDNNVGVDESGKKKV